MAIYLLIHGGFSGGWVWHDVAKQLRAAGHEAFAPTLTGLGERAHLAHPEVNLATHVQDIVGVLECEDLRNVILVGHSSGVMVMTGVAERVPERLARLVYLDTAIPKEGQSWLDLLGPAMTHKLLDLVETAGEGWRIPLVPGPPRYQPHPLKPVTDRPTITNPQAAALPRAYIHCTAKDPNSPVALAWPAIDQSAIEARQQGWWFRTLPTDHSPHRTMPGELTALLLELA